MSRTEIHAKQSCANLKPSHYSLAGNIISFLNSETDLGIVMVRSDLLWTEHYKKNINQSTTFDKANTIIIGMSVSLKKNVIATYP